MTVSKVMTLQKKTSSLLPIYSKIKEGKKRSGDKNKPRISLSHFVFSVKLCIKNKIKILNFSFQTSSSC